MDGRDDKDEDEDEDEPIEKPFYLLQNESELDIPNQQQSDKNSTIHF